MAISITNTGVGNNTTGDTIALAGISNAFTLSSCVICFVAIQDTTKSVTSFVDDSDGGSMSLSFIVALNVTGVRLEAWSTTVSGGHSGGSFIKANLSGTSEADIVMLE